MTCVQLGTRHWKKSKQSLDTGGTKHTLLQRCIPDPGYRPAALRVGSDSLYIEL